MSVKHSVNNQHGFTLIEILLTLSLATIFLFLALNYSSVITRNTSLTRKSSTKNRILSGIRDFARMPAALRISMRAAVNGIAVNPKLLACAGGNPANSCKNGEEIPLTLYSPILQRNAAGDILGVQVISTPLGSAKPMRLDSFGVPCDIAGPECPILVFTSFKAQCGPPPPPVGPPSTTTDQFVPQSLCTVADLIEVTFYVQLDPNIVAVDPSLGPLAAQASGSVVVPVAAISGNLPQ